MLDCGISILYPSCPLQSCGVNSPGRGNGACAKRVAAAAEWGCHAVTGEDCCLIIRTSILIRIKNNYQTSILYPSCAHSSRNPPLLGGAAPFSSACGCHLSRYRESLPRLLGKASIRNKLPHSFPRDSSTALRFARNDSGGKTPCLERQSGIEYKNISGRPLVAPTENNQKSRFRTAQAFLFFVMLSLSKHLAEAYISTSSR